MLPKGQFPSAGMEGDSDSPDCKSQMCTTRVGWPISHQGRRVFKCSVYVLSMNLQKIIAVNGRDSPRAQRAYGLVGQSSWS